MVALVGGICMKIERNVADLDNAVESSCKVQETNNEQGGEFTGGKLRDMLHREVSAQHIPENKVEWENSEQKGNCACRVRNDAALKIYDKKNQEYLHCTGAEFNQSMVERYGTDKVNYFYREADFRPFEHNFDSQSLNEFLISTGSGRRCSETGSIDGHVEVERMSVDRDINFKNANEKIADALGILPNDVQAYMKDKNLTWHECGDRKHLEAIPSDIHQVFSHTGGIGTEKDFQVLHKSLTEGSKSGPQRIISVNELPENNLRSTIMKGPDYQNIKKKNQNLKKQMFSGHAKNFEKKLELKNTLELPEKRTDAVREGKGGETKNPQEILNLRILQHRLPSEKNVEWDVSEKKGNCDCRVRDDAVLHIFDKAQEKEIAYTGKEFKYHMKEKYGTDKVSYTHREADLSPFEQNFDPQDMNRFLKENGKRRKTRAEKSIDSNITLKRSDIRIYGGIENAANNAMAERMGIHQQDVKSYMQSKNLTWHEGGDRKTVQAVPNEIEQVFAGKKSGLQ